LSCRTDPGAGAAVFRRGTISRDMLGHARFNPAESIDRHQPHSSSFARRRKGCRLPINPKRESDVPTKRRKASNIKADRPQPAAVDMPKQTAKEDTDFTALSLHRGKLSP